MSLVQMNGIDEVGRAHLHGGRAGNHELERVGRRRDAAHADHRNLHRAPALVDHAHRDRPDRRAAQAADDVRELRAPGFDVDRHRQERVHERHGIGAGILGGLGERGHVGDVRRELRDHRQARHLLHRADDVERAVQAAAERDAALLDVRAGDVQLERVHAFRIRQDSRELDVLVQRAAADVDDVGGAEPPQLRQLLGDVSMDADPLQADGVEHSRRRLDDALRRMSFTRLEEQTLGDDRAERSTGRRRRRIRRRSRSSRSPPSAGSPASAIRSVRKRSTSTPNAPTTNSTNH